jgi:hypothetical protein
MGFVVTVQRQMEALMSEKLRIDGMTVDSSKTYPGHLVLKLIEVAFENGRRNGLTESNKEFSRGYEIGYAAGKEATGSALEKLREALHDLL